jgi:CheY-like chemotaxis protein
MQKVINVLLIEDDADDVELLEEALKNEEVIYNLTLITDGSAAVKYFQQPVNFPDIIVMDFNLPKVHGREVLKEIKSHTGFKDIPLLILSTSSSKEDKLFAEQHGVNYSVKPTTIESIKCTGRLVFELATNSVNVARA